MVSLVVIENNGGFIIVSNAEKIIAECVFDEKCTLGEGPFWHDGNLWWVDIDHGRLYRGDVETGKSRHWELDEPVGVVVPIVDSEAFLAGCQKGLYRLTLNGDKAVKELLVDPEPDRAENRFNDGKCDPTGRFWAGTMDTSKPRTVGGASFYRFDPDGTYRTILDSVTVSNGLDWSPDGKRMYYIDSHHPRVDIFDYDAQSAAVSNRRTFIEPSDMSGHPDGMTLDADGNLWVAFWGGGAVRQFNAENGELMTEIVVPSCTTSCCFGGENYETLFITTAKIGMSDEEQRTHPESAGCVFACNPGVNGRPGNAFAVNVDSFKNVTA